MLCPCFFRPSDNVWRSRRADAPQCANFSTVISPSWVIEQISVGKCAHQGVPACRERQTSFKIVTWTKQTWTKHHNTVVGSSPVPSGCRGGRWAAYCFCSSLPHGTWQNLNDKEKKLATHLKSFTKDSITRLSYRACIASGGIHHCNYHI